MSSSLVQSILTGMPAALEISAAWRIKSSSNLRPNPPPRKVVSIVTSSGLTPAAAAATACPPCWNWIGPIILHLPLDTSAEQFTGSIVEWAKYGKKYWALNGLPFTTVALASPTVLITAPFLDKPSSKDLRTTALLRFALEPSFQVIFRASLPLRAV